MVKQLNAYDFLEMSRKVGLIDVRSPKEFSKGHIPQAVNIPLFTNKERALVGKCYTKRGRESAVVLGMDFVQPKLASFVMDSKELAVDNQVIVHCWRGGMRSQNFAELLEMAGLDVSMLIGGYKSYRQHIRSCFEKKAEIIILGGMTGSGKTEILQRLEEKGEQVLDLEGIAGHKGSAFGGLEGVIQPTNEQFENNLYEKWRDFNLNENIWIEDESRNVGNVIVPETLFDQMRETNVICIEIDRSIRIKRLLKEYSEIDLNLLRTSFDKIKKRLGGLNYMLACKAVEENDSEKAIELSLIYYDKAYEYGLSKRDKKKLHFLKISDDNPPKTATILIEFNQNLLKSDC